MWWQAACRYDLASLLIHASGHVFYGEIYGQVQDLRYDVPRSEGARLAFFDVLNIATRRYYDYDEASSMIARLGLPVAPILARGGWDPGLCSLAEGASCLASNVREGIVVRPVVERFDERIGRVILKLHGEGFLTRKGG